MSLNRITLLINASYEPLNFISARRAITMVMKGVAHVERASKHFVRTSAATFPVPNVIRLKEYRRVPRQNRTVSRKSILLRDRMTCQYCLKPFASKELTLDHVTPRCKGGPSSWENLVASCQKCNNRKADQTLAEAGMELQRRPAALGMHAKHRLLAGDGAEFDEFLFV